MRHLSITGVLAFLLLSSTAWGATIVVNSTSDVIANDGVCTLREAVIAANTDAVSGAAGGECAAGDSVNDAINFTGLICPCTITLAIAGSGENASATGDLDVTASVAITGPGAGQLTVDANSLDRVFHVTGGTVALSGMTVANGNGGAAGGGGILNAGGDLTVDECVVTGNTAVNGGGLHHNSGTFKFLNGRISGNTASNAAGGILLSADGTVSNSTINGNSAGESAGGLGVAGASTDAAVKNVTITGNTADSNAPTGVGDGGGVAVNAGALTLTNTIVAGNTDASAGGEAPECAGAVGSGGGNLISEDTGCSFTSAAGDQVGDAASPIDPRLDLLNDNGGVTTTFALLPGSPAVDAGVAAACSDTDVGSEDQRGSGFARCVDADGDGTANGIDIGAFELQAITVNLVTSTGTSDTSAGDGLCDIDGVTGGQQCSLHAAVQETNALPGPQAVNFNVGGSLAITGAFMLVTDSVGFYGPGVSQLALQRQDASSVLKFDSNDADWPSGATYLIQGLQLTGGSVPGSNGGAFDVDDADDTMILRSSKISGNSALSGGGFEFRGNDLLIEDSTISGNTSTGGPGGFSLFLASGATVKVLNSTISGNTSTNGNGGVSKIGSGGTVVFVNSTISGNSGGAGGGGVQVSAGTLVLRNATITGNTTTADDGGGVNISTGSVMDVANSLITFNTDTGGEAPDCKVTTSTITSQGYNLLRSGLGGCGSSFNQTGDIIGLDPILAPLADNGGPTLTHRIADVASNAFDGGDPAGCKDDNGTVLTTDQRGFPRTVGVSCDKGAYEVGLCGDGVLDFTEACDDGGTTPGDGCDATCHLECGDGVIASGEDCDDGNNGAEDGCDGLCHVEPGWDCGSSAPSVCVTTCGDGIPAGDEECDDGNSSNTDDCTNACLEATCGDGFTQAGAEECDDGGANSDTTPDDCRTDCVNPSCGDGVKDSGEDCDDGNSSNTDACLNTCDAASCGDGFLRTGVEACDDGNSVDDDACSNSCQNAACGDEIVQAGEDCDDGGESIGCDDDCTAAACGDGVLNEASGEDCDDGNTADGDACRSDCTVSGPGTTGGATTGGGTTGGSGDSGSGGCALIIVNNDDDAGTGSLRQAITKANTDSGPDEITFDGVTGIIELASALPTVTETLTITGPGPGLLTVDGNAHGTVLLINSPAGDQTLTVSSLTITGGSDSGLKNSKNDTLNLSDCVITGNVGGFGGGINPIGGDVTIRDCAIHHNDSGGHGGGLRVNPFTSSAVIRVINTTISANTANGFGGGIEVSNGSVVLSNVTMTGNHANTDGGGFVVQTGNSLTLANSIVAGNTDGGSDAPDCFGTGTITSDGYNFIGDDTNCSFTPATGDQVDKIFDATFTLAQVLDTTLADNGGSTPTHALASGSPAIDAGNPAAPGGGGGACETKDQRGFNRPIDGNGDAAARCDIGAFEFGAAAPACGDGFLDDAEECDDGNDVDDDACRNDCTEPAAGTTGGTTGGTATGGTTAGGTTGGSGDSGGCSLIR
ncbi:MAG TPA: choice-of-anchor Q domain-containing protein [bacterium]|nr:choice-of-anchor Q domain-containing protein [bacterium]